MNVLDIIKKNNKDKNDDEDDEIKNEIPYLFIIILLKIQIYEIRFIFIF